MAIFDTGFGAAGTFAAMALIAAPSVHADLSGPVLLDFQTAVLTIYGEANVPLQSPGVCVGSTNCIVEDGMLIGTVRDDDVVGEHLHRGGGIADRYLSYHADSSGIYVRAADGGGFALTSMFFDAAISDENPDSGAGEYWEILGFNTAENPDLENGDGTHYASRVAYQTVLNGFSGTLTLNDDFGHINAFWIHYVGFPGVPDPQAGKDFQLAIDDVALNAPVAVEPVPVPAVGLWILGGGFLSLTRLSSRRLRHG